MRVFPHKPLVSQILKIAIAYCKLAIAMNLSEALQILHLNKNFTQDELKKRYRQKLFELHPDRNKSPTAHQDFIKVREAYDFLTNSTLKEQKTDEEEFIDPLQQDQWRHHYYTPRSEYTDAEWFEYQTDPERYKQYQHEFEDEQEQSRQDYEEDQERRWEFDGERSTDNSYRIREILEEKHIPLHALIAAFNRPLERQLEVLELNKSDIDRSKRLTKNFTLDKEIDGAIYNTINEHWPKDIVELYVGHGGPARIEKLKLDNYINRFDKLDLNSLIYLLKDQILGYNYIRTRTPEEIIEIYTQIGDELADYLISNPPKNWPKPGESRGVNMVDFTWHIPPSALILLLNKVKEKIGPNPNKELQFLVESLKRSIEKNRKEASQKR